MHTRRSPSTIPPLRPVETPGTRERWLLTLFLAVFAVVNFATLARMPVPWGDEIMFLDPVANALLGRGFTTGTWDALRSTDFFAGYPPLYPVLLMGWLHVFGVGPAALRSLDLVAAVLLGWVLWEVAWRSGLIRGRAARLLFVAAALGGYGIFIGYRAGRPDVLGMLLSAASLLVWLRGAGATRSALLVLLGFLMPLTGLQLGFYAVVMYGLLLLLWPREAWPAARAQLSGVALGALALVLLYVGMGAWDAFLNQTIYWQTILGRAGRHDLRHRIGGLRDPSTVAVVLALFAVAAAKLRREALRLRSPEGFGSLVALVVPIALWCFGKFPIYYVWTVYLPALLCLGAAFTAPDAPRAGIATRAGQTAVYALCLWAVPLFTTVAVLQWHQRDPARVAQLVAPYLGPRERVLLDASAYYACVGRVAAIHDAHYRFDAREREQVTLLVIQPDLKDAYEEQVGGGWTDTGAVLDTRLEPPQFPPITYILLPTPSLRVYRRAAPGDDGREAAASPFAAERR